MREGIAPSGSTRPGPHVGVARGTVLVTIAEALAFPTALVTTVLLTRLLPTEAYGALLLALAAVTWLEWTVVSPFGRAAYKLIAEPDGAAVVPAVVRRQEVAGDRLFGAAYRASAPFFAILVVGAVGMLLVSLASGILVAGGHLRWMVAVTLPMLPVAVVGHLIFIPRAGALGAAAVTAGTTLCAAGAALTAVRRVSGIPLPVATMVRATLGEVNRTRNLAAFLP